MSTNERFLLHFPSINSFVAQKLLSVTTLRKISGMSQDELLSTSDSLDIPKKVMQVRTADRPSFRFPKCLKCLIFLHFYPLVESWCRNAI